MQWLFLVVHSVPMVCENVYEPLYNTRITWVALCDKLREVAEEFAENSSKEEYANLEEVVNAIREFKNWFIQKTDNVRFCKRIARGGFELRIILDCISG